VGENIYSHAGRVWQMRCGMLGLWDFGMWQDLEYMMQNRGRGVWEGGKEKEGERKERKRGRREEGEGGFNVHLCGFGRADLIAGSVHFSLSPSSASVTLNFGVAITGAFCSLMLLSLLSCW
jgi:hypothetical protein